MARTDDAAARRALIQRFREGKVKLPRLGPKVAGSMTKTVKFMRDNPGYVRKHRSVLRQELGDDTLALAGYNFADDGVRMQQFDGVPGKSTKLKRVWTPDKGEAEGLKVRGKIEGTKVVKVKAPKAQKPVVKKPKPTVPKVTPPSAAQGGVTQVTPPAVVGAAAGAATGGKRAPSAAGGGKQAAGPNLFDIAIQRLLGLNTGAGFQALDPTQLLAGLTGSTASQTKSIRDELSRLSGMGAFNTGKIDEWFGKVGADVDRARTRGMDTTRQLGEALAGNNQSLLASIGGEAAPGASAVGQVAQSGQNTLAAMGAADAQFLSDMGPLLSAEGASLKASELARIANMRRDYTEKLSEIETGDNSRRAELAMQIAQINNQGRQQRFSNEASVAETLAGLALSGEKLTASQQQAIAQLAYKQQQDQLAQANRDRDFGLDVYQANQSAQGRAVDDQAAMARSLDQKLARANADITKLLSVEDYPMYQAGGLAPPNLVKDILNAYRTQGVDLTDPRARKAAASMIQRFGVRVDPRWIRGWR